MAGRRNSKMSATTVVMGLCGLAFLSACHSMRSVNQRRHHFSPSAFVRCDCCGLCAHRLSRFRCCVEPRVTACITAPASCFGCLTQPAGCNRGPGHRWATREGTTYAQRTGPRDVGVVAQVRGATMKCLHTAVGDVPVSFVQDGCKVPQ